MNQTVAPGTLTRQELYDRIRESSKDEVILEEMIRLGFWPDGTAAPSPAAAAIRERGEAMRELGELQRQNALWSDPERAIKEMHKRRKAEALAQRTETRRRHAQARQDRAEAWHIRRQREVLYLGEGVSAGLSADPIRRSLLPGLPDIADAKALADGIGIPLSELRFLTYSRKVSSVSHYQRFRIPKKTGGERLISAPMPRLKRAQYWVLDNILARVGLHEAAHGFVPQRSILTNARNHVGKDVVVNLDLKDFFPTLTYARVKGMFRSLGYAEKAAIPLALLCTEAKVDEVHLDGERHFVGDGRRLLPQGAPTSPTITNLICRYLDRRLDGLANELGFTYSRYADDLTFSGSGEAVRKIGTLLKAVQSIVTAEGFTIHPDKTRIMRRSGHQEVTGLTVNERVAVPRPLLRRYRAVLQQVEKHGPAGRHFGPGKDVVRSLLGFGQFAAMIDPDKGRALLERARRLASQSTANSKLSRSGGQAAFRAAAAAGRAPAGCHWTPTERTAPALDPVLAALEREEAKKAEQAQRKAHASQQAMAQSALRRPSAEPAGQARGQAQGSSGQPARKKLRFTPKRLLMIAAIVIFPTLIPGVGPFIAGLLLYLYLRWMWKQG
ncbi:RNA-directed DNA polymerase [Labrys sp. KNU-23]|uniref:reverse transcriptase family protein n=1 Tax=Labrys sp. KNU-23 TaxID=2789216 RepID=UPI0011F064B9|nr:reverse transcriptase family protein [Labrys sp. KNU-23]QEN89919.1 RNA-directed DNA polymerase [Labrys sp. KNU-23]